MIVHAPRGSYTLEGNFAQGQANGDMRVTEAGKSDKYRRFQAGQDVGSAGAAPASPFSGIQPTVSAPQLAPRIAAPLRSAPIINTAAPIARPIAPTGPAG